MAETPEAKCGPGAPSAAAVPGISPVPGASSAPVSPDVLEIADAQPEALHDDDGFAIPAVSLDTCSQAPDCMETQPEEELDAEAPGIMEDAAKPATFDTCPEKPSCIDTQPEAGIVPEAHDSIKDAAKPVTLDTCTDSQLEACVPQLDGLAQSSASSPVDNAKPEEESVPEPPRISSEPPRISWSESQQFEISHECPRPANSSETQPEEFSEIPGMMAALPLADSQQEPLTAESLADPAGQASLGATSVDRGPGMWACTTCSFLNLAASTLCSMCSTAPCLEGWACQSCTLHNPLKDLKCAACGGARRQLVPETPASQESPEKRQRV